MPKTKHLSEINSLKLPHLILFIYFYGEIKVPVNDLIEGKSDSEVKIISDSWHKLITIYWDSKDKWRSQQKL